MQKSFTLTPNRKSSYERQKMETILTYKKLIAYWLQVAVLGCILCGNLYAGVTDGGITAYKYASNPSFVMFTDNPNNDPGSNLAPLGAGSYAAGRCLKGQGSANVTGLVCDGTPGDSVENFVCNSSSVFQGGSLWCLFSENPSTGDKAWAVKYSGGNIPTNDSQSIVRCAGTDTFDPATGCSTPPPLPTQISVEGGFIKLEVTNGNPPHPHDCDFSKGVEHWGRMSIDTVSSILYICTQAGWVAK